ncbi:MAG: fibronectin type III domain-containing protein [Candidatus Riflebacteria bacterium]|nr:fibronectin type III domain-containing protein [Candidatus Riflebacteria bacterium]
MIFFVTLFSLSTGDASAQSYWTPVISTVTSSSFKAEWRIFPDYNHTTHYQIRLNKAFYGSSTLENSMFVNGLTPGTKYSAEIIVFHYGKIIEISSPSYILTCPEKPAKPLLVEVTSSTAKISWNTVPTATGYKVLVASQTYITTEADQTAADLTGFQPGSQISVSVSAKNESGYSLPSDPLIIQFLPPPASLTVNASEIGQTYFTLRWNQVTGAASYSAFLDNVQVASLASSVTSFKYENLTPGSSYTAGIAVIASGGSSSTISETKVLLIPATPQKPWATSIATYSFTLNWFPVSGADNYKIYRDGDWLIENIAAPASSAICRRGFNAGITASMTISACNASGESPKSEALIVKMPGTYTPQLNFSFLSDSKAKVGDAVSFYPQFKTNSISRYAIFIFPESAQIDIRTYQKFKNIDIIFCHSFYTLIKSEKNVTLLPDKNNYLRIHCLGNEARSGTVFVDTRHKIRAIQPYCNATELHFMIIKYFR